MLHLVGQRLQTPQVQRAVVVRQHIGADFDDDSVSQGNDFLADGIDHD